MNELIDRALAHKKWVVLGASGNRERFGYKIPKRLLDEGYEVIPVSPNYEEILGIPVVKSLSGLPEGDYVLSVVVNRHIVAEELGKSDFSRFHTVWMQPHTWDEETIREVEKVNPHVIYGHCVLVELNQRG